MRQCGSVWWIGNEGKCPFSNVSGSFHGWAVWRERDNIKYPLHSIPLPLEANIMIFSLSQWFAKERQEKEIVFPFGGKFSWLSFPSHISYQWAWNLSSPRTKILSFCVTFKGQEKVKGKENYSLVNSWINVGNYVKK